MTTQPAKTPITGSTPPIAKGFFVDHDGYVRDVGNPGEGLSCIIEADVVQLCGAIEVDGGREILDEYVYYPSLEALESVGIVSNSDGRAVMARPKSK